MNCTLLSTSSSHLRHWYRYKNRPLDNNCRKDPIHAFFLINYSVFLCHLLLQITLPSVLSPVISPYFSLAVLWIGLVMMNQKDFELNAALIRHSSRIWVFNKSQDFIQENFKFIHKVYKKIELGHIITFCWRNWSCDKIDRWLTALRSIQLISVPGKISLSRSPIIKLMIFRWRNSFCSTTVTVTE